MGLFSFKKNTARNVNFLESYSSLVNGILIYTKDNEKVTAELKALQKDFYYATPSAKKEAKKIEKEIKLEFDALVALLETPGWAEDLVISKILKVRRLITNISSLR
jgi:hypothetical protein